MSESSWSGDGASDAEVPLLSPMHSHSVNSSEIVNRCAICTNRRQRSRLIWAVVLVWTVPLGLAASRSFGIWGDRPHGTNQQPQGQLQLVQVVFRHGARTPLSSLYWPNSTWTHCSQHPLAPAAKPATNSETSNPLGSISGTTSSSSSRGIHLKLFDPSGAPNPPPLSGDEEPQLPGGCRMGSLTDTGFQNALDLGAQLRNHYIDQHKLLPPKLLDMRLLRAESTAVQRTVTTLRGVLTGLFPNSTAVVPVAVRPHQQEVMTADWVGCQVLGNLTTQLMQLQQEQDAEDPKLQELEHQARTELQLPADSPVVWNRLRDELACAAAEGQLPPAAVARPHLLSHIDYITTQRRVEVGAPEEGHCLLGKEHETQCQQVTALTTGRLLWKLLDNMHTAAVTHSNTTNHTDTANSSSSSSSAAPLQHAPLTHRRLLEGISPSSSPSSSSRSSKAGSSSSSSSDGKADGRGVGGRVVPRLMLFSAHDTTLLPLLTALGQHQTNWPGFTSHITLELWQHKGRFSVRMLHDGEPLRLPLAPADSGLQSSLRMGQDQAGLLQQGAERWWGQAWGSSVRVVEKARACAAEAVSRVWGWCGDLWSSLGASSVWHGWEGVSRPNSSSSGGRLSSNGAGVYKEGAYVVSLEDFKQRVVQDYVMAPKDYVTACGSVESAVAAAAGASNTWKAQFI